MVADAAPEDRSLTSQHKQFQAGPLWQLRTGCDVGLEIREWPGEPIDAASVQKQSIDDGDRHALSMKTHDH